jgi:pimeloyl-ACP methyl ester carboxylesterase
MDTNSTPQEPEKTTAALTRRTLLRRAGLGAGAVLAASATGVVAKAAITAMGGNAMQGKPNVVLVHGNFVDGSSWTKVIQRLQAAGHQVVAVQLALDSLADDIALTRTVLAAQDGPTVLVGHSYGGAVITGAKAAT